MSDTIPLLEISLAAKKDFNSLASLSRAGNIISYGNRAELRRMLADRNRVVLVCRCSGKLVATSAIFLDKTNGAYVRSGKDLVLKKYRGSWASGTIAHPRHRRKGYASATITAGLAYLSFYQPKARRFFTRITGTNRDFSDVFACVQKKLPSVRIEGAGRAAFANLFRKHGIEILPPRLSFEKYRAIYAKARESSMGAEICRRELGAHRIGVSMTLGPVFVEPIAHNGRLVNVGVDSRLKGATVACTPMKSALVILGRERPGRNPLFTYAKPVPTGQKNKILLSPELYKLFGAPRKLWLGRTTLRYTGSRFTLRPKAR